MRGEPTEVRFWAKVDRTGDCWTWTASRTDDGYGRFALTDKDIRLAHRFAWELEHGPAGAAFVCHRCDNPPCVRPSHLFLGSHRHNMADMGSKERSRSTRLTADEVTQLRELHRAGMPRRALAARYETSLTNVDRIVRGETWRHLI